MLFVSSILTIPVVWESEMLNPDAPRKSVSSLIGALYNSFVKSVNFLTLPRTLGTHPETKKEIIASIGPYGPYLKHDNKFISLKEDDVTEVGINRAVDLIDKKIEETKEDLIGIHPETKVKIIKKKGIKGRSDYLSYNKKNYPIPTELNEKKLTISDAVEIIDEKKKTKKKK